MLGETMSRELYHSNCPSCGSDTSQVRELLESGEFTFCPRCQFPLSLVARKYRLLRQLGEGGFGKVYLAEHVWLDVDRERVIKVIKSEALKQPGMEKRFRREVQTTSSVSRENEHIVRVYDDFGEEPKLGYFYIMEYLQGITLEDFLLELDDVPGVDLALHIFRQICEAMEVAHRKGIIHRDLKPSNVFLIQRKDDPYFVKIFDFGVAKPVDWDRSLQLTQSPVGTPAYMSPEQCRNKDVDARADLYSLGIMLYELLVGQTPFLDPADPPTMPELIRRHISAMPPPFSDIWPDHPFPAALEQAVMTAIEKRPEDRFDSVTEFLETIKRAMEGTVHSAVFAHASESEAFEDSAFQGDMSFVESQAAPTGGVMLASHPALVPIGSSAFGAQVAPSAFVMHPPLPSPTRPESLQGGREKSSGGLVAMGAVLEGAHPLKRQTHPGAGEVARLQTNRADPHEHTEEALFTPVPTPLRDASHKATSSSEQLQRAASSDPHGTPSGDSLRPPSSSDAILFPPVAAPRDVPLPSSEQLAAALSSKERNKIQLRDPALQNLLTSLEAPIDALLDEEEVPTSVMEPLAIPAYLREESSRLQDHSSPEDPHLKDPQYANDPQDRHSSSDVLLAQVDLEADPLAWQEELRNASKPLHAPMDTAERLRDRKAIPVRSIHPSSPSLEDIAANPHYAQTTPTKASGISWVGVVVIFLSGVVATVLLLQLWLAYQGESLLGRLARLRGRPALDVAASAKKDIPPSNPTTRQDAKTPQPPNSSLSPLDGGSPTSPIHPQTSSVAPNAVESPLPSASPDAGAAIPDAQPLSPPSRIKEPSASTPPSDKTSETKQDETEDEEEEPAAKKTRRSPPKYRKIRKRSVRSKRKGPQTSAPAERSEEEPAARREEPAARREPSPQPVPVEKPVVALATIRITTQPAGVRVFVNKKPQGKTPLTLRLPQGKRVTIQLKKKGFVMQQFFWDAAQDATHTAKMIEDLF